MQANANQIFGPRSFDPALGWKWWSSLALAVLIYLISNAVSIVIVLVPMIGRATDIQIETGLIPYPAAAVILAASVVSQLTMILAMIWAGGRRAPSWMIGLHIGPVQTSGRWLTAVALVALALVAFDLAWEWIFPEATKADGEWLVQLLRDPKTWLASLIMVTVGAALSEEMLFRGFLLPALAETRLGFWGAAIVTTLLWTVIHFYSWQGSVVVAATGLALSYALWRTGSILPGIFMHAMLNGAYAVTAIAT